MIRTGSPVVPYRGRLAPSPTGLLHIGHARTFSIAMRRAEKFGGTLVLRNENVHPQRSRPEFALPMREDLYWIGFYWREGPNCGVPYATYTERESRD